VKEAAGTFENACRLKPDDPQDVSSDVWRGRHRKSTRSSVDAVGWSAPKLHDGIEWSEVELARYRTEGHLETAFG
jgi:hypothetical protein